MRKPTPLNDQLIWWRAALSGADAPIYESEPQVGYFKTRAWSRGPFIPARIWLEQKIDWTTGELASDETLKAEIGERQWDAMEAWLWIAQRPVSLKEYQWLKAQLPLLSRNGTKNSTYSHA